MSSSFYSGTNGQQNSNNGDQQWAGWANEPEVYRKVKKPKNRYCMCSLAFSCVVHCFDLAFSAPQPQVTVNSNRASNLSLV